MDIKFVFDYIIKNFSREHYNVVLFEGVNKRIEMDEEFAYALYNGISEYTNKGGYFYILSSNTIVPNAISKKVFYIDVPLFSRDEINRLLTDRIFRDKVKVHSEEIKERVINALHGLTEEEVRNIINLLVSDGDLDEEDIKTIGYLKRQMIKKGGLLEFVISEDKMENVGGFDVLKEWISRKKIIIDRLEEAKRFGVDIPKGILLVGMPGCGKSLAAKAIANILGIPLLRLDMGLILGPYVGQSEENIRKAILQSESIAPCVLWIDEIEKALTGIGGSGGSAEVTTRIFGTLLTWMQEKKKMVFVIATSNDISKFPPEFLRKGRFDEIFFVDFPNKEEKVEILKIHLRKRGKEYWSDMLDLNGIAERCKDYSGAELESIISSIVEDAFVNEKTEPDRDFVEKKLKEFVPLSESMKDKIKELKEMCKKYRFISVSNKEEKDGKREK